MPDVSGTLQKYAAPKCPIYLACVCCILLCLMCAECR